MADECTRREFQWILTEEVGACTHVVIGIIQFRGDLNDMFFLEYLFCQVCVDRHRVKSVWKFIDHVSYTQILVGYLGVLTCSSCQIREWASTLIRSSFWHVF